MDRPLLAELADRFLSGTATEEEIVLLHEWYDTADKEEIELVFTPERETEDEIRRRSFAGLQRAIELAPAGGPADASTGGPVDAATGMSGSPRRIGRYSRWIAAASILLVFAVGGYLWKERQAKAAACCVAVSKVVTPRKVLTPGSNKATLLLGDGSVVDLGAAQNGLIKKEAGTRIDKQDGRLIYDASTAGPSAGSSGSGTGLVSGSGTGLATGLRAEMNTIRTPRGGQYQLILPDGTKVWLDAASSLSYPTAFTGKDRQVQLKGEAYFEVAEDKNKPFTVLVGGMQVNVLGTHFNVMAYDDEKVIKTTLLEGAVRVTHGMAAGLTSQVLTPGQEAAYDNSSGSFKMADVDVDDAVAWKNGNFQFSGISIETVMRQIARWYDVDVEYQGKTDAHFRGTISRSADAAEVIKMLELTGYVHFSIEGKKIIVKP